MLIANQIKELAKLFKINDSVVAREYVQLLFLQELYSEKYAQQIFFKGGTAIRLVLGGSRFSEDLDFSVTGSPADFTEFVREFFARLQKAYGFSFKQRRTIAGERYLLTAQAADLDYQIFINLDFSFREQVLCPTQGVINTAYPVIFSSFVKHLAAEEILAEKIRAIMSREKGRDIYDLWFLLSRQVAFEQTLVVEKYKYYQLGSFDAAALVSRIKQFSKSKFVLDLKPFVPANERQQLDQLFDYTLVFLEQQLMSRD